MADDLERALAIQGLAYGSREAFRNIGRSRVAAEIAETMRRRLRYPRDRSLRKASAASTLTADHVSLRPAPASRLAADARDRCPRSPNC